MENRIRETIGVRPLGFRASYWRFSNHTLSIPTRGRYIYDSSLMDSEDPYTINIDDQVIVELPVD